MNGRSYLAYGHSERMRRTSLDHSRNIKILLINSAPLYLSLLCLFTFYLCRARADKIPVAHEFKAKETSEITIFIDLVCDKKILLAL